MSSDRPHPASPHAPYVAAWLRARILAGEFAPGEALPSERDLQGLFGISRDTARRAIRELRDRELVHTVAGKGTYVTQCDATDI